MDFKLSQESAYIKKIVYEGNVEQGVDIDITLPDYCADILRILKCYVVPQVTGYQVSGDRLLIDGTVLVRILYVDEQAKTIRSHEHVSPFSKSLELNNLPDSPTVKIKTKVEYVNCRAINPRRIDLHGAFSLSVKVLSRQKENFITNAEGADIQLRTKTMGISDIIGDLNRQFVLNEVLDLGESKPPVHQIIRTSAVAMISEYKVITNKLLIKGDLNMQTLYSTEREDGKLEMMEHSIPISQIIDMEGIDEECNCDIRLDVLTLEVLSKTDASGDMRLLDYNARLCAVVSASRNREIPVVIDAYSLKYELMTESKSVLNERIVDSFTENFLCKKSLDLSSSGISGVSDIWCSDITHQSYCEENKLIIKGNVTICMLIQDGEGNLSYTERPVDFEYEQMVKEKSDSLKCDATVRAIATDYSIASHNSVEVRIELIIEGRVYLVENEKIICTLEPNEKMAKESIFPALIIYYAEKGESIWRIARKYNTTVSAIMEENELKDDTMDSTRMILIPGAV